MTSASQDAVIRPDRLALGGWCSLPSPLSAEALGRAGFDWVCIDMQHGQADYAAACDMIRAVDVGGAAPIVRVPWNEPGIIGRALDAGALGIIVPMIETVDDARRAVEACLYPPLGRRSFGPLRAALRDGAGYFLQANARIAVLPMIETRRALGQVAEILAVPGVTGVFIGPMDLSVALGLAPADNDGAAAFDEALARVVATARAAGKVAAIYSNARVAPLRIRQGFTMIAVASDFGALASGVRADLAAVKATLHDKA